nr:MAG TPA: hypothetical protein [Caudoviricetes sp.]
MIHYWENFVNVISIFCGLIIIKKKFTIIMKGE